jgi:hypothetical protein
MAWFELSAELGAAPFGAAVLLSVLVVLSAAFLLQASGAKARSAVRASVSRRERIKPPGNSF